MKQRLPDTTGNISLAIVLHICGAKLLRGWRKFTPQTLAQLGFRTIEEACAKRAQGKVEICNEHTKERAKIEAIFDRVSKDGTADIPDLYVKDGDTFRRADEIEIAATIATQTLKLRSEFMDSLTKPANYWLETVKGEVRVDDSDPERPVVHFPGRTVISANACEETKRRLNERL
jgi:hypothetical protein